MCYGNFHSCINVDFLCATGLLSDYCRKFCVIVIVYLLFDLGIMTVALYVISLPVKTSKCVFYRQSWCEFMT